MNQSPSTACMRAKNRFLPSWQDQPVFYIRLGCFRIQEMYYLGQRLGPSTKLGTRLAQRGMSTDVYR